ncbi:hypothetical protein Salat_1892900 [Sesamum alatum]|uniref:Uncharacterized protein n=1 Tax=Sesamum alatum TaxID=300844 RepID=A0AAE1Y4S3_9LAMI|nr:hypothetical protein Salat_1892900 [Sesamum alatum]
MLVVARSPDKRVYNKKRPGDTVSFYIRHLHTARKREQLDLWNIAYFVDQARELILFAGIGSGLGWIGLELTIQRGVETGLVESLGEALKVHDLRNTFVEPIIKELGRLNIDRSFEDGRLEKIPFALETSIGEGLFVLV